MATPLATAATLPPLANITDDGSSGKNSLHEKISDVESLDDGLLHGTLLVFPFSALSFMSPFLLDCDCD